MEKIKNFIIEKKKIIIPVALAILLAIGGITVYAVNTFTQAESTISQTESETQTESESESESEAFTANVSIELMGVTADNVAIPAEVEIILDGDAELLDGESKTVEDMKLALNSETEIAELPEGEYTIHLLATPIEIDGSTYKLPSETISFVISEENQEVPDIDDYTITYDEEKNITISITLERLDVNDMTKEQLESVITRIQTEAPDEHQDLIKDLTSKSEQAESNPESASDIAQESESTGKSKTTTGSSNSNSSNDTGTGNNSTGNSSSNDTSNTNNTGSTGSTNNNTGNTSNSNSDTTTTTPETSAPAHTHTWVDHTKQVAREEQYVVREYDEQVQTGTTPVYSYVWTCPICGATFDGGVDAARHVSYNHDLGGEEITITKSQVQTGSTPIY